MKNGFLLLFLVFAQMLFLPTAFAKPLSDAEKQVSDYIVQNQESQLQLLEKIVNINSGTMNFRGIHRVGKIFREQLSDLGFKTYWVNMPVALRRVGALIAEHKGAQGKRVLLIGHLDTVYPKDSLFQRFERQGNIAKGPGVIDMKGGDVVILYALKALAAAHVLEKANITVVLVGDEEDSGKPISFSRKALVDVAKQTDIALDFEHSLGLNTATIARRGIVLWTLQATGNQGHSSNIFQKKSGHGAIFELARILNSMQQKLSTEKYLSVNPGVILGGTQLDYDKANSKGNAFGKENIIAQTAMVEGDLRFLTSQQEKSARKKILAIVKQHLPGTNASLTFQDAIPAMPPRNKNKKLLERYSQASVDLGYGPVTPLDPGLRGAGDISHIASIVPATLAGLGPVGHDPHSEKESLEVNSLAIATQRAALLIYRLTHFVE